MGKLSSHTAYGFVLIIMHCINPNCFDDSCEGECQQENKASQKYPDKGGYLEKDKDPDREREAFYCED